MKRNDPADRNDVGNVAPKVLIDSVLLDLGSSSLSGRARVAHDRLLTLAQDLSVSTKSSSFENARDVLLDQLFAELNGFVGVAIGRALPQLSQLQALKAVYINHAPKNQPEFRGEYIETSFEDLLFRTKGNVMVEGVSALIEFRKLDPAIQWHLIRYLMARHDLSELPMKFWGKPARDFEIMRRRAERETSRLAFGVNALIPAAEKCFDALSQGGGLAIPFVIQAQSGRDGIEAWVQAVVELSRTLARPFDEIQGPEARLCNRKWAILDQCSDTLRLLGAWGRGLLSLFSHPLCDLCYRHVAVKVRCGVHVSKSAVSRKARLAEYVHPDYRRSIQIMMPRASLSRGWIEFSLDEAKRSRNAVKNASEILLLQVKQFAHILGPALLASALDLVSYIEAYVDGQLTSGRRFDSYHRERLLSLISLRGFWMLWCRRGPASEFSCFEMLHGRGYDQYDPLARTGAVSATHMIGSLVRQRAWQSALRIYANNHIRPTQVAHTLRADGLSLREIGALIGISAPAASRWIEAASAVSGRLLGQRDGHSKTWEEYDEDEFVGQSSRSIFS